MSCIAASFLISARIIAKALIEALIPQCYNFKMAHSKLSHVDQKGQASMVNVADKAITQRVAIARGEVHMLPATLELIRNDALKKGDVLGVARIAGIQAAKRTSELIPFCHPLSLDHLSIEFELNEELPGIVIESRAECHAKTGVEMEALTATAVAALTIYDMAKSAEKSMRIQNIRLVSKTGGQSGEVQND